MASSLSFTIAGAFPSSSHCKLPATSTTIKSLSLPRRTSINPRCAKSSDSTPKGATFTTHRDETIPQDLVDKILYDALVWSSLHGLVVGDRNVQRSGKVPGVGLVHAPFALLPVQFPEALWKQACDVAPIFNELVDRVSLDSKFLQDSLSRTKKVDPFTGRLLDIHFKMLAIGKEEMLVHSIVYSVKGY